MASYRLSHGAVPTRCSARYGSSARPGVLCRLCASSLSASVSSIALIAAGTSHAVRFSLRALLVSAAGRLTPPSSGRPPAGCACFRPPLMSNVRPTKNRRLWANVNAKRGQLRHRRSYRAPTSSASSCLVRETLSCTAYFIASHLPRSARVQAESRTRFAFGYIRWRGRTGCISSGRSQPSAVRPRLDRRVLR